MLPSRGLIRSSPSLGLAKAAIRTSTTRQLPLGRTRQFGTALRSSNNGTLGQNAFGSRRIGGSIALAAASQQILARGGQARYASTQPTTTATTATGAADVAPAADLTDLASTPIDLSGSELLNMPEQIGFLKALGLEYGWGPSSMMEWVLEHIYIYTGLPWWASLATVAILARIAIFKPSLTAAEHSQKLQELRKNPRYNEAMKEMQEAAMKTKDQMAMMKARNEMRQMHRAIGLQQWKAFVPLLNVPIAYGMLRLVRGMAALPVPSLETGGMLWFPDLTIADPYFILPVLTGLIFVSALRMGLPYMAPAQQKMMKMMGVVMLPLSLVVTIYLPSGLQFYFLMTGALQWLQSWIFYQGWFRSWVGLNPLNKTATGATAAISPSASTTAGSWQPPRTIQTTARPAEAAPEQESMFNSIRGGIEAAKEKLSNYNERGQRSKAVQAAREYEERRALEEKERLIARREEKLMKKRGGGR
ncbi:mitochondrial inner membrane protein OXA1 [Diplogelasinospora grovesii]|uniref:Mitochondrial inner membrane protein OXA1 n=1 Tax=Diplogelasinospora grovesii TaxID=303347 RepID=A0AAN6NB51_9PEZI|nr:mitochondrial inner membrane protein OXA1 [Diplogelasinospora grovesii]